MLLLHRGFSLESLPVCLVEKPGSKCQRFAECSKLKNKTKQTNKKKPQQQKKTQTTKCKWERIPGQIRLVCVLRIFPWGFRNFRMNNMEPLFLRSSGHSPVSHKPKHILIN